MSGRWRLPPLLLAVLGALTAAWGQAAPSSGVGNTDPTTQARNVRASSPLQTVGTQDVTNFFDLGFGSDTGYIDNLASATGANRQGALVETLTGRLDAQEQRGGFSGALDYLPSYSMYRNFSGYDFFDQAGTVELSDQLDEHWVGRLADTASYGRYLVNPGALNGQAGGLNLAVATPLARQYSQMPSASLIYIPDYRSSLELTGQYFLHRFLHGQTTPLSDAEGAAGSATYQYRLSPRASVGGMYSYANASFGAGAAHMVSQAAALTYQYAISSTTLVSLASGPDRVQETEHLDLVLGSQTLQTNPAAALRPVQTYWTAQATLTHQASFAALTLAAARNISDSGGLLASAAVVNSVTGGAGRAWGLAWHADATLTYERMSAANLTGLSGYFQGMVAGGALTRNLGQSWQVTARFASAHQKRTGAVPFVGAFNSDSASLGIFYNWHVVRR